MVKYIFEIFKLNLARSFNCPIKPRFINFLLTYRCNARCKMCRVWNVYREKPELQKEELSLEDIESFFLKNPGYLSKLRNLGFTGGDPLLMRSDFVEIVRLAKRYLPGAHMGVQTNGLIPELARERLKEILGFYPDFSLAVSLDGIGETHARMRGIEGAFEKAKQTIRFARELGISNITAGMTIVPHNYNELLQVKKLAEGLGLEFSCFPAEVSDYFNNQALGSFGLSKEELITFVKELKDSCAYHYYMDNLRLQLEKKRKRSVPCFSGFTSLVIDPYGNVKPCVLNVKGTDSDVFGNIKNNTLKEILTGPHADKIRKNIKGCSCWCQCEVSSSVIFYPFDILSWFIFFSSDRRGFLRHLLSKKKKYSSLL